jgi:hypothetical protein
MNKTGIKIMIFLHRHAEDKDLTLEQCSVSNSAEIPMLWTQAVAQCAM